MVQGIANSPAVAARENLCFLGASENQGLAERAGRKKRRGRRLFEVVKCVIK